MAVLGVPQPAASEAEGESEWRLGGRIGSGLTVTGRPEDDPGDVTLLFGSGYTGPNVRLAGTARYRLSEHVAARVDIGLGNYHASGFAEAGELRREIELAFSAIDLGVGLQARAGPERVTWFAETLWGPRLAFSAKASETRVGFADDESTLALDTRPSLIAAVATGVDVSVASVRLPVGLRVDYNLSYPSTTRARLSDFVSIEQPGNYWVETDWTLQLFVGVEVDAP